jgi:hypothetical protein
MRTYMLLLAALIAVGAGATLLGGRETYVPGDCEMASVVGGSGTWFPCASCQPHQRCTGTSEDVRLQHQELRRKARRPLVPRRSLLL